MSETSKTEIIYGQAWIVGDSLVQEQIHLFQVGSSTVNSENIVVLIENIWDNLLDEPNTINTMSNPDGKCCSGYKTNGKKYFYWEVKMNSVSDDSTVLTVKIECPKPKEGIMDKFYNKEKDCYDESLATGDYAKFWVNKYKVADENNKASFAIQKKSVTFPETSYLDQEGNTVTLKEVKVENNDLGDITNLLGLF